MRALIVKCILLLCLLGLVFFLPHNAPPKESREEVVDTVKKKKKVEAMVSVMVNGVASSIALEDYLVGVVASEMPYHFELEALKAQSVAARTFVMQRNLKVDDTTSSQVYQSEQELKERFDQEYDAMYAKVKEAVDSTRGQVMKYKGEYISALFYSCNNGASNDASWYYKNETPYLRSVKSPWDLQYEACKQAKQMRVSEVVAALGVGSFSVSDFVYYDNGYVKSVRIGGVEFSGRQVREALSLRSSCFSFVEEGDVIIINTQGFGHGVGMSQYGADGMAKEGRAYRAILKHYYQGITIEEM